MNEKLPSAPLSEAAILGTCLQSGRATEVAGFLTPDHFHLDRSRKIYRAILALAEDRVTGDALAVADRLISAGELEACGGLEYLVALVDGLPQGIDLAHHAAIVARQYQRRQLLAAAQDLAAAATDEAEDPLALAAGLRTLYGRLAPAGMASGDLLVPAARFCRTLPERVDWLVHGVIQLGANGVMAADPKAGKSMLAADLALAVASGGDWLGFMCRPADVALVSREDNPALTGWRLSRLATGRGIAVPENIWINSRTQSREFRLDAPAQLAAMRAEIAKRKPRLIILDVLNVLHQRDENDQQEVRAVLDAAMTLRHDETCTVLVVHHFRKQQPGDASLTSRLRGSSAIAGWFEFLIGLSVVDFTLGTRRADFEIKAAQPPKPRGFVFAEDVTARTMTVGRTIDGETREDPCNEDWQS